MPAELQSRLDASDAELLHGSGGDTDQPTQRQPLCARRLTHTVVLAMSCGAILALASVGVASQRNGQSGNLASLRVRGAATLVDLDNGAGADSLDDEGGLGRPEADADSLDDEGGLGRPEATSGDSATEEAAEQATGDDAPEEGGDGTEEAPTTTKLRLLADADSLDDEGGLGRPEATSGDSAAEQATGDDDVPGEVEQTVDAAQGAAEEAVEQATGDDDVPGEEEQTAEAAKGAAEEAAEQATGDDDAPVEQTVDAAQGAAEEAADEDDATGDAADDAAE
ncbi:unnamed protein product [Prorocentrum cordatum]|uniref:Uncharacterized protein n=1 Tax=Prorocentrum cordatum TaxID=2364126 RepID=A0ABN9S7I7_9DINO|nr:unnamed protein product [Polarella glacialis]